MLWSSPIHPQLSTTEKYYNEKKRATNQSASHVHQEQNISSPHRTGNTTHKFQSDNISINYTEPTKSFPSTILAEYEHKMEIIHEKRVFLIHLFIVASIYQLKIFQILLRIWYPLEKMQQKKARSHLSKRISKVHSYPSYFQSLV